MNYQHPACILILIYIIITATKVRAESEEGLNILSILNIFLGKHCSWRLYGPYHLWCNRDQWCHCALLCGSFRQWPHSLVLDLLTIFLKKPIPDTWSGPEFIYGRMKRFSSINQINQFCNLFKQQQQKTTLITMPKECISDKRFEMSGGQWD